MCQKKSLYITSVDYYNLWKCISSNMYHDRKENKNVGTFVFIQFYFISQHCLRHRKQC
jgi:hypothetical protein